MYTEFDRANGRIGFAPVLPCINECKAFVTRESCLVAGCGWSTSLGCTLAPDTNANVGIFVGLGTVALVLFIVGAFVVHQRRVAAKADSIGFVPYVAM